jgi:glucose-6-phosphate dehydrogenase assembly protein OpcA
MPTLWDTSGTDVVKALAAERRNGGSVTSGCALTLVVVVDERNVAAAEEAATRAAQQHPMRMLVVIRRQIDAPVPRLDAEVTIGGRLGPGESVVMRMYGRLALHAESVVLPLLAPDAPVVTWWHAAPPDQIATDPLGVLAERRITDCQRADDPGAALTQRARDYAPGDTDLSWTRATPWRAELASAFDTLRSAATAATVQGEPGDPTTVLLAGWLGSRLNLPVPVEQAPGGGVEAVNMELDDGQTVRLRWANGGHVVFERSGTPDTTTRCPQRELGDMLAEELRHLNADQPYGDALGTAFGIADLNRRPGARTHVWRDPMQPATGAPAHP